jgi:ABC-type hemin transport system ATPase subunit
VADGVVLFAKGRITYAGPARDAPSTADATIVYELTVRVNRDRV